MNGGNAKGGGKNGGGEEDPSCGLGGNIGKGKGKELGAFIRWKGSGGMRLYGRSVDGLGLAVTETGTGAGSLRTRSGGGFFTSGAA